MKNKSLLNMIAVLMILPSVSFAKAGASKKGKETRTPSMVAMDSATEDDKLTLSEMQRQIRLHHAQELLGKHYRKSVVRSGEKVSKINSQIYRWTKEMLPKKHRSKYQRVAQAIIDQAVKYEFDPVFLMSVIQGESSFNPDMLGKLDEIGLMQIRPATGEWIARKYGIKWKGEKSLKDPVENVKIGAAFLSYLRERFDSHARLYLAAYNMGQRNVDNALEKNIWPKDYPVHVMSRYVQFYEDLEQTAGAKRREKKS